MPCFFNNQFFKYLGIKNRNIKFCVVQHPAFKYFKASIRKWIDQFKSKLISKLTYNSTGKTTLSSKNQN